MNMVMVGVFVSVALFAGMVICLEVGRRFGARAGEPEGDRAGMGAVEGAVFGRLGLLLAFTFSGAAQRFDSRRDLIVQEANAIGTIWTLAVNAAQAAGSPATVLLPPALNEMFDLTTTRTAAALMHPPTVIFAMLGTLCLRASMH